jgi:hypothetical protein
LAFIKFVRLFCFRGDEKLKSLQPWAGGGWAASPWPPRLRFDFPMKCKPPSPPGGGLGEASLPAPLRVTLRAAKTRLADKSFLRSPSGDAAERERGTRTMERKESRAHDLALNRIRDSRAPGNGRSRGAGGGRGGGDRGRDFVFFGFCQPSSGSFYRAR